MVDLYQLDKDIFQANIRLRREGEVVTHDPVDVIFSLPPQKSKDLKNWDNLYRDESVKAGTDFRDYVVKVHNQNGNYPYVSNYLIDSNMQVYEIHGYRTGYIKKAFHKCAPGLESEITFVEGFCCTRCGLIE